MARFHCPLPLSIGLVLDLPATAARHVQVLRMQPGHTLTLFNGEGGEFIAEVEHMGRSDVRVVVREHLAVEREAAQRVHLAVGMPANERMDWLVEKATELGVYRITPLMTERSVIRLTGERAEKKQAHWQAVAASACEQCGRNRVPVIDLPERLETWLARQTVGAQQTTTAPSEAAQGGDATEHAVLSLHASTQPLNMLLQGIMQAPVQAQQVAEATHGNATALATLADTPASSTPTTWVLLNGPEGGLNDAEDAAARAKGFAAVSLGNRVLRAETAALSALALLTLT
ncbi:16S rRNA (uracil(1498)-N(3))-methyltransferase [Limnohabitans sp. B9-3]|uniref:16S rRNA (uracil(1498)-N(3))-methyltransferase n=1 Tax=Limnohabitans sp. B9-3 TaxID=1100707 RepID=UPI000C1E0583|nr:16S rRNA (uracil(1498)-N(3))-methyltransferase [Limnohabitans sp. B9-3]PIT72938.1 16S rRNA (uracil(1498)-N(3))-methyltransferase [Limnohabitans sp. B9-3]